MGRTRSKFHPTKDAAVATGLHDVCISNLNMHKPVNNRERSELTSLRARVSVHSIRKCSIYEDLCRFQFNGAVVEGLHHMHNM